MANQLEPVEAFSPIQVFHACLQKMVHAQFLIGRALAAWHDFESFYERAAPSPSELEVEGLERDLWSALGYYKSEFARYLRADLEDRVMTGIRPNPALAELFLKIYADAAESYFYLGKIRSPKMLLDISLFLVDDFAGDGGEEGDRGGEDEGYGTAF